MRAIEFESYIRNKSIQIPYGYSFPENKKLRIIVLYPETESTGNYNKTKFLAAVERARSKGVFKNIDDSVKWQKEQRDEWE